MQRPRRRRRPRGAALAVVVVVVGLLAGSPALFPEPAFAEPVVRGPAVGGSAVAGPAVAAGGPVVDALAAAGASPGCGPVSCTYTRTGQSLFHVPPGVSLLEVDVTGAGTPSEAGTPKAGASQPKKGEAVEVRGNLALAPGVTTLEVVVGGKHTLGGTTSEIMTSTDSASQVLVAADGVRIDQGRAGGTSAGRTSAKKARARKADPSGKARGDKGTGKKATRAGSGADRLVATPTRVPVGGTMTAATGPARVVIRWRAPWQAPAIVSREPPAMTAGESSTFEIRAVAATVPTLSEFGVLPLGLTFRDQRNGTAVLEGVPLVDGVYRLRVTAAVGEDPPVTQHLRLVVRGGQVHVGWLTPG